MRQFPFSGGTGQIEEGLSREFGHTRIGVPEKRHKHAQPIQFIGFDADEDGFGHQDLAMLFGAARQICNGRVSRLSPAAALPIRRVRGVSAAEAGAFPREVVMEITAVDRSAQPQTAPVATIPVEQAAENRDVVRAIKALNGTEMFGEENQLMFRRDPETQRMVIRVVNRQTEEVVSQIPAEYVLRLAEDLKPKTTPEE
jgi:flagellar protein FlaG